MKRYIKSDTNSNLFEKYYLLSDLKKIGSTYGIDFKVISNTSGEYVITQDGVTSVVTINITEKSYNNKIDIKYSAQVGNLLSINNVSQETLEKNIKNLVHSKFENSSSFIILLDIVEDLYYKFEYYLDKRGVL